ncbi:MAG: alpha/beta hydrolase [Acidocella sp.]|nr:alpha/beta hydrolase [Acidocella sp.]
MTLLPRPLDLINKSIATTGLTITRNISYGPAPRDKINIYRPTRATGATTGATTSRLPVIIFFYGGSWQFGHRSDYQFMAALLARRGFVVAVPDYRLYPQVKFPDFLNDCAAATAFIINNIAQYGGNPQEIFLIGHSAGAYNAVMLALAPQFLTAAGSSPAHLAGVVGISGPYDFLPLRDAIIKDIFSPPADITLTQPITYARESAPPLLLLHGGKDTTVLPRNTTALGAKLRSAGSVVETKIYPKLSHIDIILTVLPVFTWRAPVFADIFSFLAACAAGEYSPNGSALTAPVVD